MLQSKSGHEVSGSKAVRHRLSSSAPILSKAFYKQTMNTGKLEPLRPCNDKLTFPVSLTH